METKTIQVRVSAAAARAYEEASEAERRKLDALISLRLTDVLPARTLEEIMNEVSSEAERKGLTPEILDEILREATA